MLLRARLPVAVAISSALIAPAVAQGAMDAHGSARQVYATGLPSKAQVSLYNKAGRRISRKRADGLGGVLFRSVTPGTGYRIRLTKGRAKSRPLTVRSNAAAPPSTDVYNQTLPTDGYGYLTTRDGTKLAVNVHPPSDVADANPIGIHLPRAATGAPTPTLIEYSGYGYA